jgi:hypothetical protein
MGGGEMIGNVCEYGSVRLKSSTPVYSFTVTPDLATHYAVKLFASGTARAATATSKVQNVYVIPNGNVTGGKSCQNDRPVCRETYHLYTVLPPSALSTETASTSIPTSASASRRRLSRRRRNGCT